MKTIKIAGVPEHFNLPWHLGIENNDFTNANINLQWINVPEGTGKMCEMLRNKQTDMAIILTEGIIKDIANGNKSKIVQIYVESPLLWGIHVAKNAAYQSINDLKNKKAAISRIGSGSQLMTYVNAKNQNWESNSLLFEIVNTIDGAVKSLTEAKSDYFMWELFMTKPLVDDNIFRCVGVCPTPWPSFVIAVRDEFLNENSKEIHQILKIINNITLHFKENKTIVNTLSERYNLKPEDVIQWLECTNWTQRNFAKKEINNLQNQLIELEILSKKINFTKIVKII